MYAKYTWLSTATEAQVRADIIALMCGQTTITSLSASCDKSSSSIITNTTVTNWLTHDAAASATSQVLRSLNADGYTYKYVQVTLTGGTLSLRAWENWNNTTHVGLNYATSSGSADTPSTESVAITYTTSNSIYIFTTPRYLITSFTARLGGSGCYVCEFSRDSNSLDDTYPCVASMRSSIGNILTLGNSGSAWSVCRYKNPVAMGDMTFSNMSYTVITIIPRFTGYNGATYQAPMRGVNEVTYLSAVTPFILGAATTDGYGYLINALVLGKVLGNLYVLPYVITTAIKLDEVTIGDTTYVMIPTGAATAYTFTMLVPKV